MECPRPMVSPPPVGGTAVRTAAHRATRMSAGPAGVHPTSGLCLVRGTTQPAEHRARSSPVVAVARTGRATVVVTPSDKEVPEAGRQAAPSTRATASPVVVAHKPPAELRPGTEVRVRLEPEELAAAEARCSAAAAEVAVTTAVAVGTATAATRGRPAVAVGRRIRHRPAGSTAASCTHRVSTTATASSL